MARRGRKLMAEINVVPYIDVMLVLLIIFMLTAPMLTQGIKVDLPKAGAEALKANDEPPLILSVDKGGAYYLSVSSNPDAAIDADTVVQRVSAILRRAPATQVLVKADAAVPYGQVVQGMVLLQRSGAEQVGFVTDPVTAARAKRN
ncbi:MAG: protein TolR [Steroidobacteraceae bacterium]